MKAQAECSVGIVAFGVYKIHRIVSHIDNGKRNIISLNPYRCISEINIARICSKVVFRSFLSLLLLFGSFCCLCCLLLGKCLSFSGCSCGFLCCSICCCLVCRILCLLCCSFIGLLTRSLFFSPSLFLFCKPSLFFLFFQSFGFVIRSRLVFITGRLSILFLRVIFRSNDSCDSGDVGHEYRKRQNNRHDQ